jgi:hypothetical protein
VPVCSLGPWNASLRRVWTAKARSPINSIAPLGLRLQPRVRERLVTGVLTPVGRDAGRIAPSVEVMTSAANRSLKPARKAMA